MRRVLMFVAMSLVASPGALADGAKPREACRADYERFCNGVKPGGGRVAQCFKAHREEISAACKTALRGARERRQSMKDK